MCAQWVSIVYLMLMTKVSTASFVSIQPEVYEYLSYYGYIAPNLQNDTNGVLVDLDDWNRAITEFQHFVGLEETGSLDQATRDAIASPRCNIKDNIGHGPHLRAKRYTILGKKKVLAKTSTYRVMKYPENSKFRHDIVDSELRRAFDLWSDQTKLTFTHIQSGKADIEIRFDKCEHGETSQFGTIIGHTHALHPTGVNEMHFDSDENWTSNSEDGLNFFQTAVHIIGHILGLSHSLVSSSVMHPYYKEYDPNYKLDEDDIVGIQKLYKSDTVPLKPSFENLCNDSKMDAIFNSVNGDTIVFKGDYYFKLTDQRSIEVGHPQLISNTWIGLPGHIDAAFTYKNSTYFFKDLQYWKFEGTNMAPSYPKKIEDGFEEIPGYLDAAFVWSEKGKIYFFKGDQFWRFDPDQKSTIWNIYRKEISEWNGIPNYINAVFQKNGFIYFFKNDVYYKYNDQTLDVDVDPIPYPRSIGHWWYGCKSSSNAAVDSTD